MTNIFSVVYENFTFDNPTITLTVILWAMYAGLLIAIIASTYNRSYVGEAVRAIVKNECYSPDTALTLEELGIKASALRRYSLRDKTTVRKYIRIANGEECKSVKKRGKASLAVRKFFSMDTADAANYDFSAARFYIPEDKKDTAEIRFGGRKKGVPGIIAFIVTAVLGLAVVLALMYFIPEILELLDDLVTYIKNAFGNE